MRLYVLCTHKRTVNLGRSLAAPGFALAWLTAIASPGVHEFLDEKYVAINV